MGMFTTAKKINSLYELFIDQIEDLYDAEKRLIHALPKMAEAAHSPVLQKAFQNHFTETEAHFARLTLIFEFIGKDPERETCDAMKGLIAESREVVDAEGDPDVLDAALIAAARRIEHYEIAAYGCCLNFAEILDFADAADLLRQTLNEEVAADHKLTQLAERNVLPAVV